LHLDAVDIDAFHHPDAAQGFQALVKESARIAEQVVTTVTEGKHREPQMIKPVGGVFGIAHVAALTDDQREFWFGSHARSRHFARPRPPPPKLRLTLL
jgi:hypothetical protein